MPEVVEVRCGVCDKVLGHSGMLVLCETVRRHMQECALPPDYEGLLREHPLNFTVYRPSDPAKVFTRVVGHE